MYVITDSHRYMVIAIDSIGYTVDRTVDTAKEATQYETKAIAISVLEELPDYWVDQCFIRRVSNV